MELENEILQRLTKIETQLDGFIKYVNEDVTEKNSDHEKRIRFLERYAFIHLGIFSLIVLIIDKTK